MTKYKIIRLDQSNMILLDTLYAAVYNKKAASNYFSSKYNTKYLGVEYLGFFALDEQNAPAAYYGVIPVTVSINKKEVLAAQSCDTMTHPEHRNKGLFVKLAEKTFDLATEAGIHFVFGFPNQNSYPGFINKLAFTHAHTLQRYTFVFEDTLYKKLLRKFKKNETKSNIPFPNELINSGYDGVVYSDLYMEYKSFNSNGIFVSKNYSAWLKYSGDTWLGAISKFTQNNVEDLLNEVKNKSHSRSFTFMISPEIELPELFNNKKTEEGFAVITKNLTNKYDVSNLKFQFADVDVF